MAKKFVLGELNDQHVFVQGIKETLEKATKQTVAFIAVDKMQKKGDVSTKKVSFNFEEGQSIALVLRTDGDVIQHFLNNKAIPLSKVMDYDKMNDFNAGLDDLGLKLKANQDKFNIKRQSARVVIPRSKAPALTVKKRIELARQTLKELGEMIAQQTASNAHKKDELAAVNAAGLGVA
jgi:hypothetical protein